MTYCESTSNDEMALHCSNEEMAFIFDLLNCSDHPIAKRLLGITEMVVRKNNIFKIIREEEIEPCKKCNGAGRYRDTPHLASYEPIIKMCDKCKGQGQRVKITTYRYESLNEDMRKRFAR